MLVKVRVIESLSKENFEQKLESYLYQGYELLDITVLRGYKHAEITIYTAVVSKSD